MLLLVTLSGCDYAVNPVEQNTVTEDGEMLNASSITYNEYSYINIIEIDENTMNQAEDINDFIPINPGPEHFIINMVYWLQTENIDIKKNMKTPLINKLNVIINMVEQENYDGAFDKLVDDIIPFSGEIINDIEAKRVFISLYEVSMIMIENPDVPFEILPIYDDWNFWYDYAISEPDSVLVSAIMATAAGCVFIGGAVIAHNIACQRCLACQDGCFQYANYIYYYDEENNTTEGGMVAACRDACRNTLACLACMQ